MKNLRNRKGFTLIEVLIVVVIIGILAALLLPRMLQQPERARIAEANQMLGVIRRAQTTLLDTTGAAAYQTLTHATAADWTTLGLVQPGATTLFTYNCVAGNATTDTLAANGSPSTCTATRVGAVANRVNINLNTGVFSCDGTYRLAAAGPTCVA